MKKFWMMLVAITLFAVAPDARGEDNTPDYTATSMECFAQNAKQLEEGELSAVINCFTTVTGLSAKQVWVGGFSPGQTALTANWHNGFTNHLRGMVADGIAPVAIWSLGFTDKVGDSNINKTIATKRAQYGVQIANDFFKGANIMPIQMAGTVANDRSLRLVIFEQPRLMPEVAQMAKVVAQQQETIATQLATATMEGQANLQAKLEAITQIKSHSVIAEIGAWFNDKRPLIAGVIIFLCIFLLSKLWAFSSTQNMQKKTAKGVEEVKEVMKEILNALPAQSGMMAGTHTTTTQPIANSGFITIEVMADSKWYHIPLERQVDGWFRSPFKLKGKDDKEKPLGGRTQSEVRQNLTRFLCNNKGGDNGMAQLTTLVVAGAVTEITARAKTNLNQPTNRPVAKDELAISNADRI